MGGDGLDHWIDAGIDRRPADEFVEHEHVVEERDDGAQVHPHVVVVPD